MNLRRNEIENSLKLCNSCCSRTLGVALGVGVKVKPLWSSWMSAGVSWYVLRLCNARLVVSVASPGIKNDLVVFSFSWNWVGVYLVLLRVFSNVLVVEFMDWLW